MAADVAGYSRLMGADEEGTLSHLKALRRTLIDPAIAAHHGRVVKTTGDGALVEFASVVDATRCAVKVQREMAERAGGTFVVKAKVDADGPPVFGKRQSGHGASGAKRGWLARTFNARRDND